MFEYANRKSESRLIYEALKDKTPVIFLKAGKAVGITSFLSEKLVADLSRNNITSLYVNASAEPNLSAAILSLIIKDPQMYSNMQACFDTNYGSKSSNILSSIVQGIPYAGDFLAYFSSRKTALPIYTGNYSSAAEEILTLFFKEMNDVSVIVIDSAQNISENSYALISDLILYNNIQFIFAFTDHNNGYLKCSNFIRLKSIVPAEVDFPAPTEKLIMELGNLYGITVSLAQARFINTKAKQNIHKIVGGFLVNNDEYHLNAWTKAIVSILHICNFPMSEYELYGIIKKCNLYSANPKRKFSDSVAGLQQHFIVSVDDGLYQLQAEHHPEVSEILSSFADQMVFKQVVLSFYKSLCTNGRWHVVKLLYDLTNELKDSTCPKYARALIRRYLQDGSSISDELLLSAKLNYSLKNDCIVASVIYARRRSYAEALQCLEKTETSEDAFINAFYGILLNRNRQHVEAEQILLQASIQIKNIDLEAIIYSFLISNYIHQENIEAAQATFARAKDMCSKSKNYGYLLRNAVSAFKNEKIQMYDQALSSFLETSDMFGYYTTLCNKGYALLYEDIDNALKLLHDANDHLRLYGENVVHIVNNNLGIAYLLQRDFESAKCYFERVIAIESPDMAYIFAQINMSCCDALAGNNQLALSRIKEIETDVANSPLNRIRQKYYINRLFVEHISGLPTDERILMLAKKYVDRYDPKRHLKNISYYSKFRNGKFQATEYNWQNLYSACGLVYWFIEPLKVFPETILDEIIPVET